MKLFDKLIRLVKDVFSLEKKRSKFVQFIRNGLVSSFALIFDIIALWILVEKFGVVSFVAAFVGATIGTIISYSISIKWVFHSRRFKERHIEFILFALIGAIGVFLTSFFVWLFAEQIGMYYFIAKALAVIIVYFWNFFARLFGIFHKKESDAEHDDADAEDDNDTIEKIEKEC